MADEANLRAFEAALARNPFSQSPSDNWTFGPSRLSSELLELNLAAEQHFSAHGSLSEAMAKMVPAFQRDNDKWPLWRSQCFVENVLAGMRSKILLYGTRDDAVFDRPVHTLILDGLQRLTSWVRFIEGDLSVYNGMTFDDINTGTYMKPARLEVALYLFDSHKEACDFYIQMNRGITHSEADIARAEQFLLQEA